MLRKIAALSAIFAFVGAVYAAEVAPRTPVRRARVRDESGLPVTYSHQNSCEDRAVYEPLVSALLRWAPEAASDSDVGEWLMRVEHLMQLEFFEHFKGAYALRCKYEEKKHK